MEEGETVSYRQKETDLVGDLEKTMHTFKK